MFRLQSLSPSITDMIRFDHSHVLVTYHQYTAGKPANVKKALAETVCSALEIHARLEEEIFYPVLRQLGLGEPVLHNSVPEHNAMRQLIGDIRRAGSDSTALDRLLPQLMREVMHHVAEEETVLLPEAERHLDKQRLNALGVEMTRRRMQLLAPQAGKVAVNTVLGFSRSTSAIVAALGVATTAYLAVTHARPKPLARP